MLSCIDCVSFNVCIARTGNSALEKIYSLVSLTLYFTFVVDILKKISLIASAVAVRTGVMS